MKTKTEGSTKWKRKRKSLYRCKQCGGETELKRTRTVDCIVIRRRRCLGKCGRIIRTTEVEKTTFLDLCEGKQAENDEFSSWPGLSFLLKWKNWTAGCSPTVQPGLGFSVLKSCDFQYPVSYSNFNRKMEFHVDFSRNPVKKIGHSFDLLSLLYTAFRYFPSNRHHSKWT